MKYLSGDSNAGDLVSQGIMANFIQKIPDILRYGIITKFLTGGTALKQVDDAWRASQGKDLQTRARIYSNAIQAALGRIPQVGAQMAQEGINEAESQAEAFMESKNVDIPNISSVIPQAPSPAPEHLFRRHLLLDNRPHRIQQWHKPLVYAAQRDLFNE